MRELELRFRLIIGAMISCVGCIAAIGWMVALPEHANFMAGMLVVDPLTQLIKIALRRYRYDFGMCCRAGRNRGQ